MVEYIVPQTCAPDEPIYSLYFHQRMFIIFSFRRGVYGYLFVLLVLACIIIKTSILICFSVHAPFSLTLDSIWDLVILLLLSFSYRLVSSANFVVFFPVFILTVLTFNRNIFLNSCFSLCVHVAHILRSNCILYFQIFETVMFRDISYVLLNLTVI